MISAPTVCPICGKRSHRGRKFWDERMFCGETCLAVGKLQGPRPWPRLMKCLDDLLKKSYGPAIRKWLSEPSPLETFNETI